MAASRTKNLEFFTNVLYECLKHPAKIDYKMRHVLDHLKKRRCIEYDINWNQNNKKPMILINITQKGMKLLNNWFLFNTLPKLKKIEWKTPISIDNKEGVVIVAD